MKKHLTRAFSLLEISLVIVIIGILIAGISNGVDLFYDSKLATAQSLTKSAPVTRIEGLFTWIETTSPESFTTMPKDGDSIALIKDLGFKMDKVNFVQNSSGNKPTYKPRNLNDLPALYFDGSNDFFVSEKSYTSNIFPSSQITIFAFINYVGGTNTAVFFKHEFSSYRTGLEINNGIVRFDFPTVNKLVMGTSSVINKNIIITAIANNINQKLYINSVVPVSIANTNTIPTSSSAPIYLGANDGSGVLPTKFNFGELIIYDRALNDREINLITAYLSKKWGIKI